MMPYLAAVFGFSSTLSLTILTLSPTWPEISSSAGAIMRHGPHHSAQKSTTTGSADFKTNRPAPRRIAEVPATYLRQLALYRAVLAKLYPDKPLRAALIWTEVPDIMEFSAEVLEAALTGITPA